MSPPSFHINEIFFKDLLQCNNVYINPVGSTKGDQCELHMATWPCRNVSISGLIIDGWFNQCPIPRLATGAKRFLRHRLPPVVGQSFGQRSIHSERSGDQTDIGWSRRQTSEEANGCSQIFVPKQ